MPASREDTEDRKVSWRIFLGLVGLVVLIGAGIALIAGPAIAGAVAPGVGLQTAALIAFGLALVVIVIMTITAGDGLIGELQFMIPGFLAFFVIAWLMIAWIF